MSPRTTRPQFEGVFSIGIKLHRRSGLRRYRMIDRSGSVMIIGGRVVLCKSTGETIAEAPVSEVRASKIGLFHGVLARIGEETYQLGPLPMQSTGPAVVGDVINVGAVVRAYRNSETARIYKENAAVFLWELEDAGGRVGQP